MHEIEKNQNSWIASEINQRQLFESHQLVQHKMPAFAPFKKLRDFLWPMSEEYAFDRPSAFLSQVLDIAILNQQSEWVMRDGIVPASWFFFAHPLPPTGLRSKIYLHHSVLPSVPEAWRAFVKGYEYYSEKNKAKDLLIFGGFINPFFSEKTFCVHVDKLRGLLAGGSFENIYVFSIFKDYKTFWPMEASFQLNILKPLSELATVQFLDFPKLKKLNFDRLAFYNIDDGFLVADNGVSQLLMQGGATGSDFLSRPYSGKKADMQSLKISAKHGLQIFSPHWQDLQSSWPLQQLCATPIGLQNLLSVEQMKYFPWPDFWLTT